MMKKIIPAIILLILSSPALSGELEDLTNYKSIELSKNDQASVLNALKENGLTAGAQYGLYERTQEIYTRIMNSQSELDAMYSFGSLVSKDGYLPPVIEEIGRMIEVKSGDRVDESEMHLRITTPAKFHLVIPSFRDYLFVGFPQSFGGVDSFLPAALKPKTDKSKKVWTDAVKEGYAAGKSQGDKLFDLNLAKLNNDFVGMWRYKRLLALGVIKAPSVAKSAGEYVVGGDEIVVAPRSAEIVEKGSFNKKTLEWKQEISK